jgi:hypothetical protein
MRKAESSDAERVNLLRAELVYSLLTRHSFTQAIIEADGGRFQCRFTEEQQTFGRPRPIVKI